MRRPPDLLRAAPDPARKPIVAVHDVVGSVAVRLGTGVGARMRDDAVEELRKVPRQFLLGDRLGRTGLHADELRRRPDGLHVWRRGIVAPRVDVGGDALLRQPLRDLGDVDVHASGVAGARLIERRGVQADDGNPRPRFWAACAHAMV